jgi:hypothetical protein
MRTGIDWIEVGGKRVGLAHYVNFALITGLVIGWISLAVGYIVGKAMSLVSRGVGGHRYQAVAVLVRELPLRFGFVRG